MCKKHYHGKKVLGETTICPSCEKRRIGPNLYVKSTEMIINDKLSGMAISLGLLFVLTPFLFLYFSLSWQTILLSPLFITLGLMLMGVLTPDHINKILKPVSYVSSQYDKVIIEIGLNDLESATIKLLEIHKTINERSWKKHKHGLTAFWLATMGLLTGILTSGGESSAELETLESKDDIQSQIELGLGCLTFKMGSYEHARSLFNSAINLRLKSSGNSDSPRINSRDNEFFSFAYSLLGKSLYLPFSGAVPPNLISVEQAMLLSLNRETILIIAHENLIKAQSYLDSTRNQHIRDFFKGPTLFDAGMCMYYLGNYAEAINCFEAAKSEYHRYPEPSRNVPLTDCYAYLSSSLLKIKKSVEGLEMLLEAYDNAYQNEMIDTLDLLDGLFKETHIDLSKTQYDHSIIDAIKIEKIYDKYNELRKKTNRL